MVIVVSSILLGPPYAPQLIYGRPPVFGPAAGSERYERVNADLAPLLGTPGVDVEPPFAQAARTGFFLLAEEPLQEDPAAVSARFAGVRRSGALAAIYGTRRTGLRRSPCWPRRSPGASAAPSWRPRGPRPYSPTAARRRR